MKRKPTHWPTVTIAPWYGQPSFVIHKIRCLALWMNPTTRACCDAPTAAQVKELVEAAEDLARGYSTMRHERLKAALQPFRDLIKEASSRANRRGSP